MKKFRSLIVIILVTICIATLCSCKKCGKNDDVIKIGSCGPLSGNASIYGEAVKKGITLAIDEINADGGVNVNGKMMKFELLDFINDEADATKAGTALTTLVGNGADIIVGAVTSGATDGLITKAVVEGIPVITPTGTTDKLTIGENGNDRQNRLNIFRACFYDSYQGEFMAKYANEQGLKKIYVLYNNDDDYSVGLKNPFVTTAKSLGITVDSAGYGAEVRDFNSYWDPIISGGYECVFIPDYYENVYNILKTGYSKGYKGICYGGDGWDGVVKQIKAGDDVSFLEKCYYTNHYFKLSEDLTIKNFVQKYQAKYNNEEPVSFAALGYDAVFIAKQAIEQAGSIDYDDVVAALTNGTFTDLVTSKTDFKFVNGNPDKTATIITFKNGQEIEA